MKVLARKIENGLFYNTLWIFVTLLLFMSYLLLMTTSTQSLFNFLSYFVMLACLFCPVLVFVTWRQFFRQQLSSVLFNILWLYCFLLHPFLLVYTAIPFVEELLLYAHIKTSILSTTEFLLTIGAVVLLTEMALQFDKKQLERLRKTNWAKTLSFEESLLLLLLLIGVVRAGFFCTNQLMQESSISFVLVAKTVFKFISFSIQLFLTSLVYYFFYYVNRYVLIPRILKTKGVIYYGFSAAAIILLCYPIFIFFIRLLPVVYEMNLLNYTPNQNLFASDSGAGPFTIMMLSVPVIVSLEWFKQMSDIANLEKEKSAAELNFLKQQINPHFFFNTLNNLYALSITKDPKTPEVVLQLSELMRYVIYKGKEKESSLKEEIQYIEDYVQLQQIRLHKNLDYQFVQEIETEHLSIPPLLFIVLIENAFKHGIEPAEKNCYLHLHLKATKNQLVFSCENSVESITETSSGIGLQNLKRRLALGFPERHHLEIKASKDTYNVQLTIDLNTEN